MDTLQAFAMGQLNRGKEMMVFDWNKAAEILKSRGNPDAEAGLSGDWEWTGGEIIRDGKIVPSEDTYTYLASTWATPQLLIDDEYIDCFLMASETDWGSDTYWPESALKILGSES